MVVWLDVYVRRLEESAAWSRVCSMRIRPCEPMWIDCSRDWLRSVLQVPGDWKNCSPATSEREVRRRILLHRG